LNGKRTLSEVVKQTYRKFGMIKSELIYQLIFNLVEGNFAINPQINTALKQINLPYRIKILLSIRKIMEKEWALPKNIDNTLTRLYQKIGYLYFTKPAIFLMTFIIILGIVFFIILAPQVTLQLKVTHHFILILFITVLFSNLTIILHELGHALATKHFGREVNRMGIGWYWVSPVAFTDTTDMWFCNPSARVIVNSAGIFLDGVIAGLVMLATFFTQNSDIFLALWLIAFTYYANIFKNLNPMLEYDGYYILMDVLDEPSLREAAILWLVNPKKRKRKFRGHEAEIYYWIACLLFLGLIFILTYLIQFYLVSKLIPSSVLGITTGHLQWLMPLLAVIISSLGIMAEIKKHTVLTMFKYSK